MLDLLMVLIFVAITFAICAMVLTIYLIYTDWKAERKVLKAWEQQIEEWNGKS